MRKMRSKITQKQTLYKKSQCLRRSQLGRACARGTLKKMASDNLSDKFLVQLIVWNLSEATSDHRANCRTKGPTNSRNALIFLPLRQGPPQRKWKIPRICRTRFPTILPDFCSPALPNLNRPLDLLFYAILGIYKAH